jgi:deoxyribose-phosphate aldolase
MQPIYNSKTITYEQFVRTFDHTLIKPNLTEAEIIEGCKKAREYGVASVHVQPTHISLAANLLKGSDVLPAIPLGFPHGGHTTQTKVFEAQNALANGAREMDMVINLIKLHSHQDDYVQEDIHAVVEVGHKAGIIVKAILCIGYLTEEEIVRACRLAVKAGVDFVKSSTGFDPSGATPETIRLMWETVGPKVQVKAAQGIRSLETAFALLDAGATRLGATATFEIIEDFKKGGGN